MVQHYNSWQSLSVTSFFAAVKLVVAYEVINIKSITQCMWSDKGHKGQASNMCPIKKKKKNRQYIEQIGLQIKLIPITIKL